MKHFISILIFITSISNIIYSQDLFIPDNPYDKADEYTKTRNSFNRERWFYEQRMFPNNYIPSDAYTRAYQQREALRQEQGFHFDNSAIWTSIGPTPGYYFSYTNISSRITSIAYNPVNPSIIYLGGAFGGVWKSTNGGLTWTSKSDFEVSLSTGALAIDPVNTNIVYYGTGEATYSGASYYGRGLLKSTDGGESWTNYTSGLPGSTYFSRIVIRPNNNSQLFAALGNSGLYNSTDNGVTWTQIIAGRCDDVVFTPSGDTAFAVGSGIAYQRSVNGGSSFSIISGVTIGSRNHLAICKSAPWVLYLATYAGSIVNVYKSTNNGLNYSLVQGGFSGGGQAWYDMYMHVNPFDPNYAYIGLIDIWRTTDGGTFINITNGYSGGDVHVDQHNAAFHPTNSNEMFAVNDGGVWKSYDRGTTWENLNLTLTLTQFYRIASDPSNVNHVMGGTQDNGTQRTTGTINWAAAFGGDGGEVSFHSQNPQYILGETQNNGVRRSQDGGNSWVSATSGLSGSGAWVGPLITHPSTAGVFYTARQQVFRSDNWGASWTGISSGTSGTIRELAISRTNPTVMYATSGSQIYKSTDAGTTFTNVTSGTPSRTITSIYVHPDSSNVAVMTFSGFGAGKVYKTTNGASSWFSISGNLPDSPTNDVLIYYPGVASNILLAAMDVGVFMTTNYGTSWVELADGLPNTVAISLDYNTSANRIRIGTHGRGVWQANGPLVGIINHNENIPDNFNLGQNFPNPFNPATIIRFSLKENSFTRLTVFDAVGKVVKVLVEKELKAGTYDVSFDGSDIASGLYFYKLQTPNFSDTKKMMMVK